jgi:glycosyltransferase involved in cell wall biosynthesis
MQNDYIRRNASIDKHPLVSVVIPTYNRANVICRTIECVREQTYPNIEIIVVDDGSIDDTQEKLSTQDDIRVIRQENAGPAAARNRGMDAARGEFIALQDSDDLWVRTKLEKQIRVLQRAGDSVVCCLCDTELRYTDRPKVTDFQRAWVYPPFSTGVWTNIAEVLATRFVFFCQTAVIRTSVIRRIGGFDETFKYHEDYELPLRLALEGPWGFVNEQLTIWNQSDESYSQKALREEIQMRECEVRMREKILAKVKARGGRQNLERHLRWELRRNRSELRLAKLARQHFIGAALLAQFLSRVGRYFRAVYRRSPWYPMMEARALDEV